MDSTALFPFLPAWPPAFGQAGWFGLLLLAAAALGEAVTRLLRAPRLLGYVAAGMVLGPHGSGAVGADTLADLRLAVDIALGLLLFELGQRLDLGWLRRNPWLLASSTLEAALAFVAIFAVLVLLGMSPMYAAAAAAIGIATSPAVVVQLAHELKSQGQVTDRMLTLSALNSAYAVVAVTMWIAWLHLSYRGGIGAVVLHPLWLIGGAVLLALVAALLTPRLLDLIGPRSDARLMALLGVILALTAAAGALRVSGLLALLAFGALMRNREPRLRPAPREFAVVIGVMTTLLFAVTGASLDPRLLFAGGVAALAYVLARCLGKAVGVLVTARLSGLSWRKGALLGATLTPMSGLAVVVAHDLSSLYPGMNGDLLTVVVGAVVVLEFAGPLLAAAALRLAGETHEEDGDGARSIP